MAGLAGDDMIVEAVSGQARKDLSLVADRHAENERVANEGEPRDPRFLADRVLDVPESVGVPAGAREKVVAHPVAEPVGLGAGRKPQYPFRRQAEDDERAEHQGELSEERRRAAPIRLGRLAAPAALLPHSQTQRR